MRDLSGRDDMTIAIPDLEELSSVSARFEDASASQIIQWAHDNFGDGLVLAASFQDCVLIDIAATAVPDVEVVFLDTQYHFEETLAYVETIRERYDLNLTVMHPEIEPDDLWKADTDKCCALRKVEPLARALEGKAAWMTGLRRADAPSRAGAQIVGFDVGRGLVKINPIATWTDLDVQGYTSDRELPVHPLANEGFPSIGCSPCTKLVADGEHPRSGRWAGTDKIECGLHD